MNNLGKLADTLTADDLIPIMTAHYMSTTDEERQVRRIFKANPEFWAELEKAAETLDPDHVNELLRGAVLLMTALKRKSLIEDLKRLS